MTNGSDGGSGRTDGRRVPVRAAILLALPFAAAIGCETPESPGPGDPPDPPYDRSVEVVALAVEPGSITVAPAGQVGLSATARYADGTTLAVPAEDVAWVVDPPGLAAVDAATGVLTGVAEGEASLYAGFGGVTSPGVPVSVRVAYTVTVSGATGDQGDLVRVELGFDPPLLDSGFTVHVAAPPLAPFGPSTEWGALDSATYEAWFLVGPTVAAGDFPIEVRLDDIAPDGAPPAFTVGEAAFSDLASCSQLGGLTGQNWPDPNAQAYTVGLDAALRAVRLSMDPSTNGPTTLWLFGSDGGLAGASALPEEESDLPFLDLVWGIEATSRLGLAVTTAPDGDADPPTTWNLDCASDADVPYTHSAGFADEDHPVEAGALDLDAVVPGGAGAVRRAWIYLDLSSADPLPVEVDLQTPAGTVVRLRDAGFHREERQIVLLGTAVHAVDELPDPLPGLSGEPAGGTWRLHVVDGGSGPTAVHGYKVFVEADGG